jgi:hypothetical protein
MGTVSVFLSVGVHSAVIILAQFMIWSPMLPLSAMGLSCIILNALLYDIASCLNLSIWSIGSM